MSFSEMLFRQSVALSEFVHSSHRPQRKYVECFQSDHILIVPDILSIFIFPKIMGKKILAFITFKLGGRLIN